MRICTRLSSLLFPSLICAGLLFVVSPAATQAQTTQSPAGRYLSISPPNDEFYVVRNTTTTGSYTVFRTYAEMEESFDTETAVTKGPATLISGPNKIHFKKGEEKIIYSYSINTKNVEPGDYQAEVYTILSRPTSADEIIPIIKRMGYRVTIHVVGSKEDIPVTLSLQNIKEADLSSYASVDGFTGRRWAFTGEPVDLVWELHNKKDREAIRDLVYTVRAEINGHGVLHRAEITGQPIAANATTSIHSSVSFDQGGNYDVLLDAAGKTLKHSIFIIDRKTCYAVLGSLVLLLVVIAGAFWTVLKKRRMASTIE